MDRVLGCRPATQPILMIESQAEEEDGEDTEESAVSTNTSLIAETDSDDDSEKVPRKTPTPKRKKLSKVDDLKSGLQEATSTFISYQREAERRMLAFEERRVAANRE
ncbi:hypothetical protein LSAT2_030083, partial [Lamellibrachia satsuma]